MPNFFYFDQNNQKHGPVDDQQLKALAAQGVINPNTPMETDTGHKGTAGQIPGLTFNTATPISVAQSPQVAPATLPKATFFYYDANGQKYGPVDDQQLKSLAAQGVINPNTPMKTDTGHKGTAGQIPGLFTAAPPPVREQNPPVTTPHPYPLTAQTTSQDDNSSNAKTKTQMPWLLYVIIAFFVLIWNGVISLFAAFIILFVVSVIVFLLFKGDSIAVLCTKITNFCMAKTDFGGIARYGFGLLIVVAIIGIGNCIHQNQRTETQTQRRHEDQMRQRDFEERQRQLEHERRMRETQRHLDHLRNPW